MNIFDKLASQAPTPFVIPGQRNPLALGMTPTTVAQPQANPFDQFDAPQAPQQQAQPQQQPQQVAQPDLSQHEQAAQNPFDQFDEPAPQAQPQHAAPSQQMDGTPMRYRNAANGEGVEVADDGLKSVADPVRGAAAQQLMALLGDRRNSDAAVVQFAQDHGVMSPSLLLQLKFRKDNPGYTGAYKAEGWDHREVPMTTGDKIYNYVGNSGPGVYLVNTGLAAGDLGNGVTGGALEHAFGDADLNRAKVASINAQHPTAATLGTITGSIAGGVAADKAIADVAGKVASPVLRAGVRVLGDAASGAAQGAGAAPDGSRADGALLGAVLNPIAGVVSRTAARGIGGIGTANPQGQEVLDAAGRLNAGAPLEDAIRPLPGHVSSGGVVPSAHALLEPSFIGGKLSRLQGASQQFEQNAGKALGRIADDAAGGSAQDLTSVAAQANDATHPGSLAAYGADSKQVSDEIYGNAARLAGNTMLATPRTINAIDGLLAKSAATPGGIPGFEKLAQLREDLANGRFTVDGLRTLRTSFGDSLDASQRTAREAANTLWPTLSQDISLGLNEQGNSAAAKAYRLADRQYAQRAANMEVISRVIGPNADLSADQVANRIASMSKLEYPKLAQAMGAIHPDQAAAIRGGLIDSLGKPTGGAASAGEGFNLNQFGTRWAKLSPQAKAALYPANTVRDLDDLATLAAAQKRVVREGNPSRSGITNQNWAEIMTGPAAVGATVMGHPGAVVPFMGIHISGQLLATPGVARAMVALAQNKSVQVVTRRLAEVARRNPAAQAMIHGLVSQLNGEPDLSQDAPPPAVTSDAPLPAVPEPAVNPYALDRAYSDPSQYDPNQYQDPSVTQ